MVCQHGYNNKFCAKLNKAGRDKNTGKTKFKAYQNEHLPKRWHLRNSRTGPCTIVAEPGYGFSDMWDSARGASAKTNIPGLSLLTTFDGINNFYDNYF